jgi:hypothetical protein
MPPVQWTPQAPQFALLLVRSMQAAPHRVWSAPQSGLQAPLAQSRPGGQALPHAPQWEGSDARSTHASPQWPRPIGHWHAPATQVAPSRQEMSQEPQWSASLWTFTHALEQSVSPAPHEDTQAPAEHTSGAPQALPQAPQLAGSLASDVHAEPHKVSSGGQAHVPPTHICPSAHATPHAPQCSTSDPRSTHPPPQAVRLPVQDFAHVPRLQTWAAGQDFPQPPQFLGSFCGAAQCPSHSTSPAPQAPASPPSAELLAGAGARMPSRYV